MSHLQMSHVAHMNGSFICVCVAECCSVLQWCNVVQYVAAFCSMLRCGVLWCRVLQYATDHLNACLKVAALCVCVCVRERESVCVSVCACVCMRVCV